MAITQQDAGEIIWKLKADLRDLEKGLGQAEAAVEGTTKAGGEHLELFKGKFLMVGAAAIGAAYAMIKSSPSLAFGMEEISLRFQHLAAIIGEEFYPIIEELIIPALDALIPIFEQIAPLVGEVVGLFVNEFKKLQPIFERVLGIIMNFVGRIFEQFSDPEFQAMFSRLVDALGRIATVIIDSAEPAIDLLFDAIELIMPILDTFIVEGVELLADVLEEIGPVVTKVLGWFKDIIEYIDESGFLSVAIKVVTGIFGALEDAIKWVGDKIEDVIGFVQDLIEWFEKVDTGGIRELISLLPGGTMGAVGGGGEFGGFAGLVPGHQAGGYVLQGGFAYVHPGEIIPAHEVSTRGRSVGGGVVIEKVELHLHIASIRSDLDIRRMARQTATEFKYELERKVFV